MARTILTAALIILLGVFVGCDEGVERGRMQLRPRRTKLPVIADPVVKIAGNKEADIVEHVSVNRQAYRESLVLLVNRYNEAGNNMKLQWAEKELKALNSMPQYNYIVEASLAGSGLRAVDSIVEADELYEEALQLEKKAKELVIIRDDNLLRQALDKYNQLIRTYPTCDKIDDAAYRAGGIHEDFKDYTIAILYYQRTYQWDPATVYPAVFNRAYILDRKLHRMADALVAYKEAVANEGLSRNYREFAEMRIAELSQSGEAIE